MATLGGKHIQAGTGRELMYWVAYYCNSSATQAHYVAVISERCSGYIGVVGEHEDALRVDPAGIPVEPLIRHDVLRVIDRSRFGESRKPDPNWIGWYGPYR